MNVILTINGGSSSIKFAIYSADSTSDRLLGGEVQRVGQPGTTLSAKGLGDEICSRPSTALDQAAAADQMIELLEQRLGDRRVIAIGHRVVHGGLKLIEHQVITTAVLEQLHTAIALDAVHLPREIALIERFGKHFSDIVQVACFDSAFHQDLPTVAKMLPIPRTYYNAGVRRLGFHGISCTFLMEELRRVAGDQAANGRVILAHLGSGASLTAVKEGKPIDTSMGLTPLAGIMMGTRPGDLDPGLIVYLLRTDKMTADQLDEMLSKNCGLKGVSGISSDMRDLIDEQNSVPAAKQAVDAFTYSAKKMIGAYTAALGGLDTLIFAGGIGEHSVDARLGICQGLEFMGINLDTAANRANAAMISTGPVAVRVVATDEESMIARITRAVFQA